MVKGEQSPRAHHSLQQPSKVLYDLDGWPDVTLSISYGESVQGRNFRLTDVHGQVVHDVLV